MNIFTLINIYKLVIPIIIGFCFSSCENRLSINEEEISQPVSDVLTILFDDSANQNCTDTTINFSQYVSDKYKHPNITCCILDYSNTSTKIRAGKILRISALIKSEIDTLKIGKEIIVIERIESNSGIVINGKFERELYNSDYESSKTSTFTGFIRVSNLPSEIIYLNNLKSWNDGGISGIIEMKGKSKLLFERTGSTLFFENNILFGKK